MRFLNLINPFSNRYHALNDFSQISSPGKAFVCVATGVATFFSFGLLTTPAFRLSVKAFKKAPPKREDRRPFMNKTEGAGNSLFSLDPASTKVPSSSSQTAPVAPPTFHYTDERLSLLEDLIKKEVKNIPSDTYFYLLYNDTRVDEAVFKEIAEKNEESPHFVLVILYNHDNFNPQRARTKDGVLLAEAHTQEGVAYIKSLSQEGENLQYAYGFLQSKLNFSGEREYEIFYKKELVENIQTCVNALNAKK